MITSYDYVFSENGLVAYKDGTLIAKQVKCAVHSIFTESTFLQSIIYFLDTLQVLN